jgi:hypothetical protein
MNRILTVVIIVIGLVGCKAVQQPVVTVPIQYKERIVERLVPVKINNDSLKLRAMFECDSLNRVVLKQSKEAKSKGVESSFSFDNGVLDYSAETVHDTVYVAAKDSFIYKEVPVYVNVPVEVNKLTKWQGTQIMAGRLLLLIVLAFGIYRLLKWKLKF